jgi:hypothetical protein
VFDWTLYSLFNLIRISVSEHTHSFASFSFVDISCVYYLVRTIVYNK